MLILIFIIWTQECECGLYVCMEKFYGFGREHVEDYHRKTGRSLFLHLRRIKRAIQKTRENATEESGVANPPAEKVIIYSLQISYAVKYSPYPHTNEL